MSDSYLDRFKLICESAMALDSLDEAYRSLASGIGQFIAYDSSAGLFSNHDEHLLFFYAQDADVHCSPCMLDHMAESYSSLSGNVRVAENIRIVSGHMAVEADTYVYHEDHVIRMPIRSGDTVVGLFTLFKCKHEGFSAKDRAIFDEISDYLSFVLLALSRIRELSVLDKLTDLYNREYLELEFKKTWESSQRYGFPVSVALIDLDHFKRVNDTFGHFVGDNVIRSFSGVIRSAVRATDIVGRYGGDEIVVILPHSNLEGARTFGQRICKLCQEHHFLNDDQHLKLTVSVGIASTLGESKDIQNESELFAQADQALYEAKRKGRNQVYVYNENEPQSLEPLTNESIEAYDKISSLIKPRVLIADDNVPLATVVKEMLSDDYLPEVVYRPEDAIEALRRADPDFDVAILDINFPTGSGFDILQELKSLRQPPLVIMVTGLATLEHAIKSMRQGAYDFIPKPVRMHQLLHVVEKAMEVRRLRIDNARYQNHLEDMVRARSAALRDALAETERSYRFTLEAMVRLLDERTDDTSEHSHRVRRLSVILGEAMGLSGKTLDNLDRGALLHDVGKLAIPDSILHKPGRLNEEEWVVMRSHAELGYQVLRSNPYLKGAAEIVLSHHEKVDGSGYPRGLVREDICLGARIFSVIDAYDAMRSRRQYKGPMSVEESCSELVRCKGAHFDENVVDVFLAHIDAIESSGAWPE